MYKYIMALVAALFTWDKRTKKFNGRHLYTGQWKRIWRPGRNQSCHCGSMKKYKHCCWQKDEISLTKYGKLS